MLHYLQLCTIWILFSNNTNYFYCFTNQVYTTGLFIYPVKTSENQTSIPLKSSENRRFPNEFRGNRSFVFCFHGVQKETSGMKWVNRHNDSNFHSKNNSLRRSYAYVISFPIKKLSRVRIFAVVLFRRYILPLSKGSIQLSLDLSPVSNIFAMTSYHLPRNSLCFFTWL